MISKSRPLVDGWVMELKTRMVKDKMVLGLSPTLFPVSSTDMCSMSTLEGPKDAGTQRREASVPAGVGLPLGEESEIIRSPPSSLASSCPILSWKGHNFLSHSAFFLPLKRV